MHLLSNKQSGCGWVGIPEAWIWLTVLQAGAGQSGAVQLSPAARSPGAVPTRQLPAARRCSTSLATSAPQGDAPSNKHGDGSGF